ncbi:MAG: acyltransferase [Pseudomonadota bacterium]|nr:acyltransferase [Pseudomonadota bacterium]
MKREILTIQYLRAIAVLLVVYVHALEQFPWLKEVSNTSLGHAGVDLFFVISGFIMVYSTHNKSINGLTFFWHRILRVVPLYWFFTLSIIMVALIVPDILESVELVFSHVLSSFFFVPHLSPVYPERYWPVLIPGWTLHYEMAFYALFAVSLFLKDSYRLIFLTLVMVGLVLTGFQSSQVSIMNVYTDMIILEFLIGAVLGYLFVNDKLPKNTILGFIIVGFGLSYFFIIPSMVETNRFFSAGIAASLVVLGALLIDHSKKNEISWLHLLGNASYSIYLSHVFALGFYRFVRESIGFSYSEGILNGALLVGVAIVFSTLVGVAVYRLIEMPMNYKLRKKPH